MASERHPQTWERLIEASLSDIAHRRDRSLPEHASREIVLRLDHLPRLINGLLYLECRQNIRNREPQDIEREVAPRAYSSSVPKRLDRVWDTRVQLSIVGEEAGRVEDVWVWISIFVAEDGPEKYKL